MRGTGSGRLWTPRRPTLARRAHGQDSRARRHGPQARPGLPRPAGRQPAAPHRGCSPQTSVGRFDRAARPRGRGARSLRLLRRRRRPPPVTAQPAWHPTPSAERTYARRAPGHLSASSHQDRGQCRSAPGRQHIRHRPRQPSVSGRRRGPALSRDRPQGRSACRRWTPGPAEERSSLLAASGTGA
jgi:hypothetical protein